MKSVWVASDNIISPLGFSTDENYNALREGKSGISLNVINGIETQLPLGKIKTEIKTSILTRFDQLCILSAEAALKNLNIDASSSKTIFILSTTKGNIDLLGINPKDERLNLYSSAKTIANHFKNKNIPIVVSNACISGVMAIATAKYLLATNQYDNAIVIGADTLSYFVVSGFQSLQALSNAICKPFDKNRNGINLGEAVATMVLTSDSSLSKKIKIAGTGLSNDANHISGPSRTGEELNLAIQQAISEASIDKDEVDFISAHGTATLYNDEMESKAFHHAQLQDKPVHSLKAYYGHTLGAAGILEAIICCHSLLNDELIASLGFEELGVNQPLHIIKQTQSKKIKTVLKTASGFGGCNAALILKKEK